MTLKRTPLKRKSGLKKTSHKKLEQKRSGTLEMQQWFLKLWDEREEWVENENYVICFETGKKLLRKYYRENSCCYSHILPKSKFPQYRMCNWNLVIVHPDAHSQFETYPEKAQKQYELKKVLLKQHLEGKLDYICTNN